MDISCAFATSSDTPAHVELAESLGYRRAWLYDSPALYPDVWMILTRCAERTSRIGLGPGVLVPSLRHPMVNAAAIAELVDQAPGRVAVAVRSGFTGECEEGKVRMLILPGFGAKPPVRVPILIGADGPKGLAVAAELGDGVLSAAVPQPAAVNAADSRGGLSFRSAADWRALLSFGSVLDEGEELTSARVVDALAPSAVVMYHAMYERGGAAVVDAVPGGRGWREAVEAHPENERHLAIHEGHLVKANPRDEPYVADLIPMASAGALTGTAEQVAARVRDLAAAGVTEVAYQPAGSDIQRELRAFASATGIAG